MNEKILNDKIFYSYKEFDRDIDLMLQKAMDLQIDYIVGIYRGSLVPAVYLSNILELPMGIIKFQSRDGEDKEVQPLYIEGIENARNVWIIDDIYDTGLTMQKAIKFLKDKTTATLHPFVFFTAKKDGIHDGIDYIHYSHGKWVVFPWE